MKTSNICYIVDINKDIESICAVEYLHATLLNKFTSLIISPNQLTPEGEQRLEKIKTLFNKARVIGISNVNIYDKIPSGTSVVIVDGPLTKVAEYINDGNALELVLIHGGFAGKNAVPAKYELPMYRFTIYDESPNLSIDIKATEKVLKSAKIDINKIMMIGNNVCNSKKNTPNGKIWKKDEIAQNIFKRYNIVKSKTLGSMLACKEGILQIKNTGDIICEYSNRHPIHSYDFIKWGVEAVNLYGEYESEQMILHEYRKVLVAINIFED